MLSHIQVRYHNNVIMSSTNILYSFTQRLTLRIPRTSNQIHPSFTSGINNHQKLHVKLITTCEYNQYIHNDEGYVTVEFKFKKN